MTEDNLNKLKNARVIALSEFDKSFKIIFGEGFKYKWLEHYVDVIRVVNMLARVSRR